MVPIKVYDLIKVLIEYFANQCKQKPEEIEIKEIGMFAGEKLYEELFSIEEADRTFEMDDLYIVFPQLDELANIIKPALYPNLRKFDKLNHFNSNQGPYLSKEEIKEVLIRYDVILEET